MADAIIGALSPDLADEYVTRSSTVTACQNYTGIDMGEAWSITVTSIKLQTLATLQQQDEIGIHPNQLFSINP